MGFTVNLKQFNETKRNEKAKIKRQIITVKGEDEGDAMTMTKNSNFNKMPESKRFINKTLSLSIGRTNTNTIKAFQPNHVPRTFALSCC